ncbi:MAG: hemolysin family protein [Bauldia sp.]
MLVWQLAVVAFLFLLNGFFAMSELAIVSSRRARLQTLADQKVRGANRAIKLLEDPTGFLSTVQVGITLVGVFNGAFSGTTLSEPLAEALTPWLGTAADQIAIIIVVVAVTYFSLIIGELVPKRIALNNPERIASFVAPFMTVLAKVGAPIVWFLRLSTETVLRLLRLRQPSQSTVTEEEVRSLIAEGTESGVFQPEEREMLESVIRVADRSARSIVVPRPEVVWIDIDDPPEAILREIMESGHSRFPVSRGEVDEVIGILHVKDLIAQAASGPLNIEAALREPLFVDEHMPILKLFERFQTSPVHMAIVLDEHGSFEGIITPVDILTAIAGDLPEHDGDSDPDAVQREDGSWLLSGRIAIEDVERAIGVSGMNEDEDFRTLAGFVLQRLGHIPVTGEAFTWRNWRFEVVDLDGRRIDKVVAGKLPEPTE